jgi:hypothetical protein
MQRELWTGIVDSLPRNAPPPATLIGLPTLTWSGEGRIAQIELRGLIDHRGWVMLFQRLHEVHTAQQCEELVLTLSVRAAVARGSLAAMMALEAVAERVRTTARLLDCCGAAFVLSRLCSTVTTSPGHFRTGLHTARWLYGDGAEPLPADDVRHALSSIAYGESETIGSRLARPVVRGDLTEERAQEVAALLHQLD